MCFHPVSSTKEMGFCIFFWFTWELRFLPYPVLINYLGSRHYHTSRGWLVLELVVVVAELTKTFNLISFWEVRCFHPVSSTKEMGFCIFFWFTWELRFLPYPVLINYLGSRHYHTSRGWLYWNWLWWWLSW